MLLVQCVPLGPSARRDSREPLPPFPPSIHDHSLTIRYVGQAMIDHRSNGAVQGFIHASFAAPSPLHPGAGFPRCHSGVIRAVEAHQGFDVPRDGLEGSTSSPAHAEAPPGPTRSIKTVTHPITYCKADAPEPRTQFCPRARRQPPLLGDHWQQEPWAPISASNTYLATIPWMGTGDHFLFQSRRFPAIMPRRSHRNQNRWRWPLESSMQPLHHHRRGPHPRIQTTPGRSS